MARVRMNPLRISSSVTVREWKFFGIRKIASFPAILMTESNDDLTFLVVAAYPGSAAVRDPRS